MDGEKSSVTVGKPYTLMLYCIRSREHAVPLANDYTCYGRTPMTSRKCILLVIVLAIVPLRSSASSTSNHQKPSDARMPAVIFDTDMGADCDDAGALAVLHHLADADRVRILGVVYSSGKNPYGVGVCDAINTYQGRGDLPLGQYKRSDVGAPNDIYSKRIATDTQTFGHDVVDEAPGLVGAYKKMLREEPDDSVTIITVGHPHGLVHVMRDREGARLVRSKVKRWVAMGGQWNWGKCGSDAYMEELLQRWPQDIYVSLAGKKILTGHRRLPGTPEKNPVREAYRLYRNSLRKGRSSWDQLAVLFVACPKHFKVIDHGRHVREAPGKVIWDSKGNNPRHHLVVPKKTKEELEKLIEGLMVGDGAAVQQCAPE